MSPTEQQFWVKLTWIQPMVCGCHWEPHQAPIQPCWLIVSRAPQLPAFITSHCQAQPCQGPQPVEAWPGTVEIPSTSEGNFWSWPAVPCPVTRLSRTSELSRRWRQLPFRIPSAHLALHQDTSLQSNSYLTRASWAWRMVLTISLWSGALI